MQDKPCRWMADQEPALSEIATCQCTSGKAVEEVSSLNQTLQPVPISIEMDNVGILSLKKLIGK